jgi:hypothetical protein
MICPGRKEGAVLGFGGTYKSGLAPRHLLTDLLDICDFLAQLSSDTVETVCASHTALYNNFLSMANMIIDDRAGGQSAGVLCQGDVRGGVAVLLGHARADGEEVWRLSRYAHPACLVYIFCFVTQVTVFSLGFLSAVYSLSIIVNGMMGIMCDAR